MGAGVFYASSKPSESIRYWSYTSGNAFSGHSSAVTPSSVLAMSIDPRGRKNFTSPPWRSTDKSQPPDGVMSERCTKILTFGPQKGQKSQRQVTEGVEIRKKLITRTKLDHGHDFA